MKIVVDGYGGDNAPEEIVKGCIKALEEKDDLELIITGKEAELKQLIEDSEYKNRITIVDAPDVISNDDSPAMAIKTQKQSSLVVAFDILMTDKTVGTLVSCGSTGAVLSGGILKVGRIKGVLRPTLLSCLPTSKEKKVVALVDTGANVDCKPEFAVHFAKMACIYMQSVYNVKKPKVGLLSNGAEDNKGNAFNKEAFALLKSQDIDFYGNIEARDMLSGKVDVIVSDGFAGNIALKSAEGTALLVMGKLKEYVMQGGFLCKLGALMLKPAFKKLKKSLDYSEHGGAVFLGIEKPIIKGHGSSKAKSVKYCILQGANVIEGGVADKIYDELAIKGNTNAG